MGGNNSYEVSKAIIQAKMLSGRYRTEKLQRHFYSSNTGLCEICPDKPIGSLEHILIQCSVLEDIRSSHFRSLENNENFSETSKFIISSAFNTSVELTMRLLLDCSTLPDVIIAVQACGDSILQEIFRFSRNWCFSIHKRRLKLQGRWKI